MKKAVVMFALVCSGGVAIAQANPNSHDRAGYVTKNGTYVAPGVATNPNDTKSDNYSSRPNTNPVTGKEGTKDPYAVVPVVPKKN